MIARTLPGARARRAVLELSPGLVEVSRRSCSLVSREVREGGPDKNGIAKKWLPCVPDCQGARKKSTGTARGSRIVCLACTPDVVSVRRRVVAVCACLRRSGRGPA